MSESASSPDPLVWLITGASSGIGRAFVEAILQRGDKVIATARARSFGRLRDLEAQGASNLELDVTSSLDDLKRVVKAAVGIYGRIDVLVNNAGYGLIGALEETTPEETLLQFNTNLFGGLNLARAVLPCMRERKSGTVVWVGSVMGHNPLASLGVYSATRSAMRSMSSALHLELSSISPHLRSLCAEFGFFRTSVTENCVVRANPIHDYDEHTVGVVTGQADVAGKQPGDPVKGANAVVDIVRGEGMARGKPWPAKSVMLGKDSYEIVKNEAEGILKDLELWRDLSRSTDFDE